MERDSHSKTGPALLWLGRDLRLADNPALAAAMAGGRAVLPVFVLDDAAGGGWAIGGASRWWLHHSLTALAAALERAGSYLMLRRGDAAQIVPELAAATGASAVHVGEPVEPWRRRQTESVAKALAKTGVALHRHRSALLFDPDQVRTKSGGPYGVFTPFSRACEAIGVHGQAMPAPARITSPAGVGGDRLESWQLLPTRPDWSGGIRTTWSPGEAGAAQRLREFLATGLSDYDEARNMPGAITTSMLSPHLHWGEISARQVWHESVSASAGGGRGAKVFRTELLWREFSAHLLWHHQNLPEQPLRPEFAAMRWRDDPAGLHAWQRGLTGIPLVDAGMRQLWQTGWQHNRVRMVTASFLIKHLLIDWRLGQAWFWDTLVDADLASNAASWQWVAGCGADAAPFFRVFNPALQGQKFDPKGAYIRRYVPELARLPDRYIHAPWEATELELRAAGVVLGRDYPAPIIDLAAGRQQALAAFNALPGKAA
jgi:deoxyribodipyrimidine photo-lyase